METADALSQIYECRARGIFRNQGISPLVGDQVEIQVTDEEKKTGLISRILPRSSALIRPAVANVNQALILFAVRDPSPNTGLLDRFLANMEHQGMETVIFLTKCDLDLEREVRKKMHRIYETAGYPVIDLSCHTGEGLPEAEEILKGKVSVLSGPSGVGKSSFLNLLSPETKAETGTISRKIRRGRNTTRHTEWFDLDENTVILDTPGFSSVRLLTEDEQELQKDFREIACREGTCRFAGCRHMEEPGCTVREAVQAGKMALERYESYRSLYTELKDRRKW